MAAENSIVVRKLSKVYEPTPGWMRLLVRSSTREPVVALDSVTFDVNAGQICAIIGPNGAGKSTLFRILTGLTTPTSGDTSVCGFDPVSEGLAVRRRVGFMAADDRTLFLRNTCVENLVFHGRLQGLHGRALHGRVSEVLDLVGLAHARDRAGFALSSGMRARLQLARALLHEPDVLILDEPTGAIDPVGAFELLRLIQDITTETNTATLVSSHRVEEIDALRDNVMLLDQGKMVYWGNLDQVRRLVDMPRSIITLASEASQRMALTVLEPAPHIDVLSYAGREIVVATPGGTGSVLSALGTHVSEVSTINEVKMPMHELLSAMIKDGTGPGTSP